MVRHQCRAKGCRRPFPGRRPDLDPDRAIGLICGRRYQLGICRTGRLPRFRQIHVALCPRKPRQGQVARRQAVARAGRAVPHRRDVSMLLQRHVRAGIRAEAVPRPGFQFHRAGRGDRHQPAVRLCRRVRRAVVDAMGAAEADRAHLSGKPAQEQPRHRAGLYRVGQRVQRQQLQSSPVACRFQDQAARRGDGADPRHRGARRHERDERHRQPRHRVCDRHRGRGAKCRRHRASGRARHDAARGRSR